MGSRLTYENWALGLVVIATLLTGLLGVFKTFLTNVGINDVEVTFIKFFIATIVMGAVLAIKDPESLKLKRWQDLGFLTFFALVNIGFTVAIFYAMDLIGVGLSSALQGTSAYFVLGLAAVFFHEKITLKKLLAVCIGFIGCLFVVNLFGSENLIDPLGILLAVGSAFGIAVFWLGCKYAGKKGYTPGGTIFYLYLISVVILVFMPDNDIGKVVDITINTDMAWFYIIGAGIVATMIPKYMVTEAYQTADAGKVAVCESFDMVTSVFFGALFLGETVLPVSIVGVFLIVFSIAMLELKSFDRLFERKKDCDKEPA